MKAMVIALVVSATGLAHSADLVVYGISKHRDGVTCDRKQCNETNPGIALQLNLDKQKQFGSTLSAGPVYTLKVGKYKDSYGDQINGSGFQKKSSPLGVKFAEYAIGGYPYGGVGYKKFSAEVLVTHQVAALYFRYELGKF